MTRSLLIQGMIAGLVAGLLVFAAARVFGEPPVDRAIAFESAMNEARASAEAAAGHAPEIVEPELVSRANQAGLGLFTGTMVYSVAFGGIFALLFAFTYGRMGPPDARLVSLLLATGGILAVFLVPNLKYPSNPPAVGLPETLVVRTELYFTMMACSIGALVAAVVIRQRLAPGHGSWTATLTAAGFYAAFVAVVMLLLPAVQEGPGGFDAVVLWQFRLATIAMQMVMWTTLGLVFGALAERAILKSRGMAPRGAVRAAR